jgi:uncharacterized protein (TIGR03790 family)
MTDCLGRSLLLLLCTVFLWPTPASARDTVLRPANVAIVINEEDPQSREVGEYYRRARDIPQRNVVKVRIPGNPRTLTAAEFQTLRRRIDQQLKPEVEVIVLVWTAPYAVECNSITSALTLGFDARQCADSCAPGKPSPYYDSPVTRPRQARLRLSMLLPASDVKLARALIDRGRVTGFQFPQASAYFVATPDVNRSIRAKFFPPSQHVPDRMLNVHTLRADGIENRKDIMFYLTGAVAVPHLQTLGFLPGALADHMTSAGGDLLGQSQMSSLKWLEAGATASYGTVSEPCNHWQKFPHPLVLLARYLSGESAVEAYWKSVAWPAQGLFIGEPLAAPYCRGCRRESRPAK